MLLGKVKQYDDTRGWGFIKSEDDGDVFVHSKGIEASSRRFIKPGVQVQFVIIPSEKGIQAAHVRVIK